MEIRKKLAKKFLTSVVTLGIVIFLASGSFRFWQGWVFLGIYFLYLASVLSLKEIVLVRRMQKENDKKQNMIAMLFALGFILNFLIIGLSGRFHWQQNSLNIELI